PLRIISPGILIDDMPFDLSGQYRQIWIHNEPRDGRAQPAALRSVIALLGVRATAPVMETCSVSPATLTSASSRAPHNLFGRTTTNASDVRTRTRAAPRLPERGDTTCAETTSPTLPSTKITRRREIVIMPVTTAGTRTCTPGYFFVGPASTLRFPYGVKYIAAIAGLPNRTVVVSMDSSLRLPARLRNRTSAQSASMKASQCPRLFSMRISLTALTFRRAPTALLCSCSDCAPNATSSPLRRCFHTNRTASGAGSTPIAPTRVRNVTSWLVAASVSTCTSN